MIPTMALLLTITILLLAMVDLEAVDLGRNLPRSATDVALVALASAEAASDAEVLAAVALVDLAVQLASVVVTEATESPGLEAMAVVATPATLAATIGEVQTEIRPELTTYYNLLF